MDNLELEPRHLADQIGQLETLRHIALALTSQTDSTQLLQDIIGQAVALLKAKSGGVYEYHAERGELTVIADAGRAGDLSGQILPADEGMAGHLISHGLDYLAVADYDRSPYCAPVYRDRHPFGAVIEVPLRWREQVIGVLYVDDAVGRVFTADDAKLLRLFADHAAIALANARVIEADRSKVRRLELLASISSGLIGGIGHTSLPAWFDQVVRSVTAILEAETAGIFLVEDEEWVVLRASYGHRQGDHQPGMRRRIGSGPQSGLISHLAAERKIFCAHGERLRGHFAVRGEPSHTPSRACHSVLVLPLFDRQAAEGPRYLGFIRADNKKDAQGRSRETVGFGQEDIWLLQLFADIVVAAIQAADLVARLRERKEHFERLVQDAPIGIVVNDRAGAIVQVNQTALEILGGDRPALHGAPIKDIYYDPEEPERIERLLRDDERHRFFHQLSHLRSADGEQIPIKLAATWLYDARQRPWGSVGYFEDLREIHRRESLLEALDEACRHIRASSEMPRLMQEIVQLAAKLMGCQVGGLYLCHPHLEQMELRIVNGLPGLTAGERQPLDAGLAGAAYRMGDICRSKPGRAWLRAEPILGRFPLGAAICVPLHGPAGEVPAILVVADLAGRPPLSESDSDVLKRFASHASLALQTAGLIDREERFYGRLRFLHVLSDFIQTLRERGRVAHAVLTGVTAGYGLGLNRAVLLLLEGEGGALHGFEGIGELSLAEATRSWDLHHRHGMEDFRTYADLLEQGAFDSPSTVIGRTIRGYAQPVDPAGGDLFSRVIAQTHHPQLVQHELLPPRFAQLFQADGEVVIVPLMVRGEVVGLLVADNKFTRFPISDEDIDALTAFADTAAVTIESLRLYERSERKVRELHAMRELAETLASGVSLQTMLTVIATQAQRLLQADSAVIWSYDAGRGEFVPSHSVAVGIDEGLWQLYGQQTPSRGGTIQTVLEQDDIVPVEDVYDHGHYQFIGEPTLRLCRAIDARSFMAIGLKIDATPVGVLFVNFNRQRRFSPDEGEMVRAFASYVRLILKRSRLHEQIQKAREAARLISRVTVIEDLQRTLQQIVEGLKEVLPCDAITVYEYNQAYDRLRNPPIATGLRSPELVQQFTTVPGDSIVRRLLQLDQPRVVPNTADDPEFRHLRFARDEGIVSCLAIPLRSNQERVGVIFINYRSPHSFSGDELEQIGIFADQAADAIRYAQTFQSRRTQAFVTLYNAARMVAHSRDLQKILDHIAEETYTLTSHQKSNISLANIRLYDHGRAQLVAAYPPEKHQQMLAAVGDVIDLSRGGYQGRRGVMGRAIETGESQLVNRVADDPDYIATDPQTRAELAVPICAVNQRPGAASQQVLGVINVEHPAENVFDEDDQLFLEALAAHAAIAIQNARRFQDLQRILEWVTMVRDSWLHSVGRDVGLARGRVMLIRQALGERLDPQIAHDFDKLSDDLGRIAAVPLVLSGAGELAVTEVRLNDFLRTYIKIRWRQAPFRKVETRIDLDDALNDEVVLASPYGLQQALEILIDNAVQAMIRADSPLKRIFLETRREPGLVEIIVRDTGPGIPLEYQEFLFERPIQKQAGSRGAGVGLTLARTFLRSFDGMVGCAATGSGGTTMVITLPTRAPLAPPPQGE